MDAIKAAAAAAGNGAQPGAAPTFLTALAQAAEGAQRNAVSANVAVPDVATIKLQAKTAKRRAQAVKRDPKTGLEIKNEWQRDTDIMYYLSSGNVAKIKDEFDTKSEEYQGEGLTLVEFVFVMIKCLGAFVVNQVDFVVQAVDLFRQVDVNDDGTMTWDEFTSYIVEAGLAQGTSLDNSVPVEYRYRFIHSVDHNVHNSPIDKVYRLPAPLSCVATIERGSEMLKLYRPSADPSRAQLKQMKLVRHDTAYSPHEVLTCLAIAEAAMLVTSSKQSLTGPFHISFWDADTLNLVHRVTTQTPHTVMCWSQRAQTLFSAGHGVGAGTSSPIIAWNIKTFQKIRSLVWHTSHVTDMVEVPGNVMNHLVSASHDGSLVLWDMRTYTCVEDRVIVAHEFGVRAIAYSHRLGLLASYGAAGTPSAGKAATCYAVHLWSTPEWVAPPSHVDMDEYYSSESDTEVAARQLGQRRPRLLVGHLHPVIGVQFQDDESIPGTPHIISADVKGIVKVWHAATFECMQTLHVVRVPSMSQRQGLPGSSAVGGLTRKDLKTALLSSPQPQTSPTRTRRRKKKLKHRISTPGGTVDGESKDGSEQESKAARPPAPRSLEELMAEAQHQFTPHMLDRTIADEYEVVSADDSEGENSPSTPAIRRSAQLSAPRHAKDGQGKFLLRLDSILALPPSATAASTATVILCGDSFAMMRLQQIVSRPEPLVAVEFNATSFTIVSATATRVTVWDAISGRVLRAYAASAVCSAGASITSMCLDGRQRKFIVGDSNGCIRICNFTNGAVMKELDPHNGVVSSLVYSKADGCVISTSWDSTVHVCDERPQYGYSSHPAYRTVMLRRVELPAIEHISELADTETFHHIDNGGSMDSGSSVSSRSSGGSVDGGVSPRSHARSRGHSFGRATGGGSTTADSLPPSRRMTSTTRGSVATPHHTGFGGRDAMSLGASTRASPAGVHGNGAPGALGEGVTRKGFSSVDVTIAALSPHLNLFACAARGMNNAHMVLLWRYDKTILNGACVLTGKYRDSMAEVTALAFLEPVPLMVSATADGNLFLWAVKPHADANIAKAVWSAPPKYRKSFTSVAVVDTANHPMLPLRCTRQKRRFSVLGCNRAVGRGFVLFTGDDTGVIHRWELSRAFLERLGAHETPRVRRSATVERRMGNPCIQPHVLAGIIAGVRSSRRLSRATPVEGAYFGSDDAEACAASAVMPVWCGCWQAHADGVSILQWMPESETLLSGSADGYARVWTFDGVLLGTLDPNPRNQPAPKLNPDVLTQQLAQKLQKEAEQRALFKESALSVTGSAHPSRPGTASGRPRSPARGSGSLLVEEETQALLRQAAAAVKRKMLDEQLTMPDVMPTVESRAHYADAENMYQFAFKLGQPPPIKAVVWHLVFDLEARRRRDEKEAHVILPNAHLLHTAKTWKRKTILRHKGRKDQLKQAHTVLEKHGLTHLANSGSLTSHGNGEDDDGGGDGGSDSSGSVASVLMADEELIAAQELQRSLEEPRLTKDGHDPLLGMLSGLADADAAEPSPRRLSMDPIYTLLKVPRLGMPPPTVAGPDRQPRASTGHTSTPKPTFSITPGKPAVARDPPPSPITAGGSVAATPQRGGDTKTSARGSVAGSVDSLDADATNEYLVNYSALGHRSRRHKDFAVRATNTGAPSYFAQYNNLKAYRSLLPPSAMPSSPNNMHVRRRKRAKPTMREVLATTNPLLRATPPSQSAAAKRHPLLEVGDLDQPRSMLHHPELIATEQGRPRTSSALRYVRSSSVPALRHSPATRGRSHAPSIRSGVQNGPGTQAGGTDGGTDAARPPWEVDAELLQFSHAAGPGTWTRPSSPNPLRPGLVMFDRNPRSAVDAGGTRYPPILSNTLRPGAASHTYRALEQEWRRHRKTVGGSKSTGQLTPIVTPPVPPTSRLGKSLAFKSKR